MSVRALAARPAKPVPYGTYSAPRETVLTLVAPDSQIYDGGWHTVTAIGDCDRQASHDVMCRLFVFTDRVAHLLLSDERWIRHPVGGA